VSLDTQDRLQDDVEATDSVIRARMDAFDLMTRVLGCESDVDRAELLNLTTKMIQRARKGYVGSRFVARTLTGLRAFERELIKRNLRPTWDALFEAVVVPVGSIGEVTE